MANSQSWIGYLADPFLWRDPSLPKPRPNSQSSFFDFLAANVSQPVSGPLASGWGQGPGTPGPQGPASGMYSSLASSGQSPSSLPLPSSGSSYPSSVAPGIDAQRTKKQYEQQLAEWRKQPTARTTTGKVIPLVRPELSPSGVIYYQKPDPYLTSLIDRAVLQNLQNSEARSVTIPASEALNSPVVQQLLKRHGIDPSDVQGLEIQISPRPDHVYFSTSLLYQPPGKRWPVAVAFTWGNFVPAAGRGQSPSGGGFGPQAGGEFGPRPS